MANIALHLGSAGLTIALFVGAVLLAMEGNDAWGKFFVIGIYLATWNTVHAVTRRAASLLIERSDGRYAIGNILMVYGAGFLLSAGITWTVASRLIKFVGAPL